MKKLLVAAVQAALLLSVPAHADDLMKVRFVQSHPAFVIGEEIFIYVVPKQMGYYAEEGLDVSIENATSGVQAVQTMLAGRAEFATGGADGMLSLREKGGDPFAFASIKMNNGWLLGVKPDSPIKSWTDVKGKTLGTIALGSGGHLVSNLEMRAVGLSDKDYNMVALGIGAAAAAALVNDQVDGIVYYDSLFSAMENNGIALRYVQMPEAGKLQGQIISTTDKFAAEHPEAVIGMCRAIAKGRHFAQTNAEASVAMFYKEFPQTLPADKPLETAIKEGVRGLKFYLEYSQLGVPYGDKTGWIVPENVVNSQNFYKEIGLVKGAIPATDAYTNTYFDQCNDFDHAAVESQAKNFK